MVSKINDLKDRIISLMSINTTPHKIAIGVAVAMFWNFIPSLGVGPILTFVTTKLLKGNIVAGITWNIATSFFIPLFYTLNLITGRAFTGSVNEGMDNGISNPGEGEYIDLDAFSIGRLKSLIEEPEGVLLEKIQSISLDFIMGSVINASIAGLCLYVLFLFVLKRREEKISKRKVR